MIKSCLVCGTELREDAKFCSLCGRKVEQQPLTPMPPPPTPTPPQPTQKSSPPQQKERKPRPSVAPARTKDYGFGKKTIIGVSLSVVVVAIVIYFIISLLGGTNLLSSADSRFVGEWEQNTLGSPIIWNFKNDNMLENLSSDGMMVNVGTWEVNGTLLCLYNRLYNNTVCYTYEFSNNGNILQLSSITVSQSYSANILLTKKDQPGASQTPALQCSINSDTNRIIITSVDENVKWKDIAIITNPAATWQIQDADNKALAKIGIIATITTYVAVGDNILVLTPSGAVTISLMYIPTNAYLGEWTLNV
jgi:hypothetical protein